MSSRGSALRSRSGPPPPLLAPLLLPPLPPGFRLREQESSGRQTRPFPAAHPGPADSEHDAITIPPTRSAHVHPQFEISALSHTTRRSAAPQPLSATRRDHTVGTLRALARA